ncbi:Hypothetical protein I596_1580 [Dokdonella koreensis DS-123]|uniref:Uncharacterized protein n=1 Tax=Dokdonella koreensis DS-123 TaxID=1300342 RepID=A0A160DTQ4_9GAMM|nr:Hypothetical protein I596_1580 [Dokdonella koreensis DS-123]
MHAPSPLPFHRHRGFRLLCAAWLALAWLTALPLGVPGADADPACRTDLARSPDQPGSCRQALAITDHPAPRTAR